jgi:sulfofructose kinase
VACLGLGIIPLDQSLVIDRFPQAGGKLTTDEWIVTGGGPVPNCLFGLTRMGCTTALIAARGTDPLGTKSLEDLRLLGMNLEHVVVKPQPSDTAVGLIERGSGRRTFVLCRQLEVKPRDIHLASLPLPRMIHLDGRDLEAGLKLARWGHRIGATITFDIGSERGDVSPLLPLIDHLIVADSFALPFTRTRSARAAIRKLSQLCPGSVVVTEGERGSTGLEAGQFSHQPAFKVKCVDTTGAGDLFHTGYLYGLLQGWDMIERLRFGAATAALNCMKLGARAGAPSLTAVRRFLKKQALPV